MRICIIEGKRPSLMPEGPVIEKDVLGANCQIDCFSDYPISELVHLKNYDAVIVRPGTPFGREFIEHLSNAKVVVALGVGFDHVDLEYARYKNIPVCNVPDYGTEEVADTAVSMIMYLHRKLGKYYSQLEGEAPNWDWKILESIKRCSSTQVGLIGLGRIGMAAALRLKAFNFNVSYYDPYLPRGVSKSLGISRVDSLDKLLGASDVVSIHTPLNNETEGLINQEFLEKMKTDAILVNCSRGKILSSLDILLNHLNKYKKFRVGLDVLPDEPPVPNQIFKSWKKQENNLESRLLINPHSAFYSVEAVCEIRKFAAEIVSSVLKGNKPYNKVN